MVFKIKYRLVYLSIARVDSSVPSLSVLFFIIDGRRLGHFSDSAIKCCLLYIVHCTLYSEKCCHLALATGTLPVYFCYSVVPFKCNHIPTAQPAQKVPVLNIEQIIKNNKIKIRLDYPLKREQGNGNDNILLRRVVQAPAVTEISKGPLQQYFGYQII